MNLLLSKKDLKQGRCYVFLKLLSKLYLYSVGTEKITLSVDAVAKDYLIYRIDELEDAAKKMTKLNDCVPAGKHLFTVQRDVIKYKESFISIDKDAFLKIMHLDFRWDRRMNILYHYCFIIASLNYGDESMIDGKRGIYGYMSNAFFANAENVKRNVIIDYNNVLEKHDLIVRIKNRWSDKYNRYLPNIYALKENEELLNKIGDNVVDDPDDYEDLDNLFG